MREKNAECGCIVHPGETHEEHMDRIDAQINRERLETGPKTRLSYYAFATAEIRRLEEKERNMRLGKIRRRNENTNRTRGPA